jgi:two-component system, sensor histidine kinase and response regulator
VIGNAIKFTQHGGIQVDLWGADDGAGQYRLCFRIKDTGIGVSPSVERTLFQAFVQGDDTETRPYGGTGLGLIISQRLLRQMGGDLCYEKCSGPGAQFLMECRLAVGTPEAGSANPSILSRELESLRVVVADRSGFSRKALEAWLESWNVDHACFSDLSEAVKQRSLNGTDVLLLHRELLAELGKPGQSMLHSMLQNRTQCVVIGEDDGGHQQLWQGSLQFLAEPIQPEDLCAILGKIALRIRMGRTHASALEPKWYGMAGESTLFSEKFPLRILLVEDSPMNQKVMRYMMGKLGYRADVVENGEEALRAVKGDHYDLVLMDLQMPVMGGVECCRRMRDGIALLRSPFICALTANVSLEDQLMCRQVHMDDFLGKPICVESLKQVLRKAHAHREAIAQVPANLL